MRTILSHICSIKEICQQCPFRKSTTDPALIRERRKHLFDMKGDILYRIPCKSDTSDYADGNQPFCRGAAVYLVKTGKMNAVLKLAMDEGILTKEELMADADLVID